MRRRTSDVNLWPTHIHRGKCPLIIHVIFKNAVKKITPYNSTHMKGLLKDGREGAESRERAETGP